MGYFQKSGWDGIGWWMIDEWMMVDGMSVCSKKRVFFHKIIWMGYSAG
jgi:hypothetical protein